jgi:WSC domain
MPCFSDTGNPRTLQSASYINTTGMTEESCVTYCKGLKYIYAGVEYSQECCKSDLVPLFDNISVSMFSGKLMQMVNSPCRLRQLLLHKCFRTLDKLQHGMHWQL